MRAIGACAALAIFIVSTSTSLSIGISSDIDPESLNPRKTTPLGLYLSSEKANQVLAAHSDILFVDVRDPDEIAISGHPAPIDLIIPVKLQSHSSDAQLDDSALIPNENFLQEFEAALAASGKTRDDIIFITCGAGMRSAEAVRILATAGYTNVWHLTDGYNGDDQPGINAQNAWLNAGLPWSHRLASRTPWMETFLPY